MSAIFGLIRHDSTSTNIEHLNQMADAVRERGPDGVGVYAEGPIGLGIARLQTCPETEPVDVESEKSPVIVAAARLDNREELISNLGISPKSPDTVILRHAHRKWGINAPEHLLGAFVYAAWDANRKSLVLARDQIGVRPLYLAQTPKFTAFASDPRSILALPEITRKLDDTGIFNLFFPMLLFYDKESTCYSEIKRVPPAHVIELNADREYKRSRYWSLNQNNEISFSSDDQYVDAFREIFTKAVSRRLRAQGEISAKLSGGLDSSSISSMAAKILAEEGRPPLHTFSAEFPSTPSADESDFSRAVAKQSLVIAHQFMPGEQSPLEDLPLVLKAATEPFYAPNFFISSGACKAAQAVGSRVILDGTDGDTAVGHGVDLLHECALEKDWAQFSHEANEVVKKFDSPAYATKNGIVHTFALPKLEKLISQGNLLAAMKGVHTLGVGLGLSRKKLLSLAMRKVKSQKQPLPDLSSLNPDFVARAQGVQRLKEFSRLRSLPLTGRSANQFQDLTSGAVQTAVEFFDRFGSLYGVEYRYPFCDRELIEFCLALPSNQQLHNGWSRWILRRAMDPYLPAKVCWRGGKADLSPITGQGLLKHESKRFKKLADSPSASLFQYVRSESLNLAWDRYSGQKRGRIQGMDLLWRSAILEMWLDN